MSSVIEFIMFRVSVVLMFYSSMVVVMVVISSFLVCVYC